MNKLKLLYDVVTTLKEKESVNGSLVLEGKKDQVRFLSLRNDFQKNFAVGEVKAKISAELDMEGKKVKHETSLEFNSADQAAGMHRHWGRHMHHHFGPGMIDGEGIGHPGIKHKLTALASFLNLLDTMQVSEREDKTWLTLNLGEFLTQFKTMHAGMPQGPEHELHIPLPFREFAAMEKPAAELTLQVNKKKEVEQITFKVEGKTEGELGAAKGLSLQGELQFAW
ncbi:Hypothetical protein DEACI_2993 [Acididesulfobacillus acetoxydans]|uniref:Uncharacterized protein n=1 Tax=Acididesulfobacillus acetoxydans TaxID=1561005 RepID=A0A8S0W948_9FIRM|nr:hypothetical protein [Acididesulfobacillus acetoxydans]CAA7602319.1 Hypothetical protein DEACI_2993 [Acididesulfobacillus acetoxydans]CEJ08446.1 Hypothetical protein DEACI_2922 [Acididesulfobacillus acetoxydans]